MVSKKQRKTEATINTLRASFYQLDLPKQRALIDALRKEPIVRKNKAYQLFLEECAAYYAQGVYYKQEQDRLKRQEAEAARIRAIESLRATRNPARYRNRRRSDLHDKERLRYKPKPTSRPIITPPKELGNCTACGRQKIADMIFCIFCAHKYEVEIPQSQAQVITDTIESEKTAGAVSFGLPSEEVLDVCEKCKAEKIPNNKFCGNCGKKY